ncbi:proton extrusion protein PcxA [Cylindrospermopsis raciborskii]|uniref:Proton extrusion protein PxcA n=1 Tax=Cylindrospermopsis raciborskii CENA302 TaxID=1170768 RepID=A0A9Q5QXN2_9CYAN|nr:proton extrusion protein PcxA [Cylindrospermopsis raciborskii]NLQ05480.1 proton extrusion protein PcxA [Cylindrospermopsis raciborskii MVCC19]OHY31488.1 proton extrusion protein PcxA [Cylindrospermopsis raciborskii MVCC14]OPH10434.1 proton extrusion protein PcxA [Cylindrospermopsis raciborskii CENA302]
MNTKDPYQRITTYWIGLKSWIINTPQRSVLAAYRAAWEIRNIEIQKFNGQKISPQSASYSGNVMEFWQGNLNRNLTIIKIRLAEFNLGMTFTHRSTDSNDQYIDDSQLLEKLKFIDEVIASYTQRRNDGKYVEITQPLRSSEKGVQINNKSTDAESNDSQKKGVFPGSIARTLTKIARDFTPTAESDFIKNYRISRNKTRVGMRFFLLIIIIPLIVQNFSKNLLFTPLFTQWMNQDNQRVFLNREMEEKALNEVKTFERKLQFQNLLHMAPPLSPEEIEIEVKDKALDLAEEFRRDSSLAIGNIFADVMSLISFAIIIGWRKKDIEVVQSLLDKIAYGLSDSAKAFIIILITDIFVGFHSPHGWEIILESLAEHLGLPASRNVIFLFIATFPVILNTIFKYWIFRYLSRLSPSALATLKEMDE